MSARLAAIRRRRQLLLMRVAVQRLAVTRELEAWRTPLAILDAAITAGRRVRRHPWLLGFAAVLLLKAPHRQVALWATRAITAWKLYRTTQDLRAHRR